MNRYKYFPVNSELQPCIEAIGTQNDEPSGYVVQDIQNVERGRLTRFLCMAFRKEYAEEIITALEKNKHQAEHDTCHALNYSGGGE